MLNKEKNLDLFCSSFFPKTRKAQTADGLTWLVATLVIIVILLVFVYITNVFVEVKDVDRFVKGVFSSSDSEEVSRIDVKTTLAIEKNSANRETIERWVKNEP